MYSRSELEEYQDGWTEAERDLAINFFRFLTWGYDDSISTLTPINDPIQKKELERTEEVHPYKKESIPA